MVATPSTRYDRRLESIFKDDKEIRLSSMQCLVRTLLHRRECAYTLLDFVDQDIYRGIKGAV